MSDDEMPPEAVPLDMHNGDLDHLVEEQHNQPSAPMVQDIGTKVEQVPVMLLTGFLGSGKTTLINYILTQNHGYRCAVLLNEFADSADIEKALIKEPEENEASPLADWVQLENGCICCSAKNNMVQALESLLQQRDRFDYLLIETTGLANPGPVAAALWTDEELESSVCLDAIVTVVDAKHIAQQLSDPRPEGSVNEAQQQVACADIVLLNKTDLVSNSDLDTVEESIRAINASALVIRCLRCEIDLSAILNTGMYTAGTTLLDGTNDQLPPYGDEGTHKHSADGHDLGEEQCGPSCDHPDHQHGTGHGHSHNHNHGGSQVHSVTLVLDRPLVLTTLRHWLDELLWERGTRKEDMMRIKGLLYVSGSPCKWVLQAVHDIYDVTKGPEWEGSGTGYRYSKLVFIGRYLDRERLMEDLLKCCEAV